MPTVPPTPTTASTTSTSPRLPTALAHDRTCRVQQMFCRVSQKVCETEKQRTADAMMAVVQRFMVFQLHRVAVASLVRVVVLQVGSKIIACVCAGANIEAGYRQIFREPRKTLQKMGRPWQAHASPWTGRNSHPTAALTSRKSGASLVYCSL